MVDLPAYGGALLRLRAQIAQLVERIHGKDEVTGSNPVLGSTTADRHGKEGVPGLNLGVGSSCKSNLYLLNSTDYGEKRR